MQNLMARIEINPKVMFGKPVVRHTRITVESILKKLSKNVSVKDILDQYPKLEVLDVKAALAYACEAISTEEFRIPVGSGK